MKQITKKTIFSDLLINFSFLIPLANRFGIKLGVGEKSIATICKEHDINSDFFITILNFYLSREPLPEEMLSSIDVADVLDYVKTTIEYISQSSIPNIEKHLSPLIAMSDIDKEELKVLNNILSQFKSDFNDRIQQDFNHIVEYPYDLLKDLKSVLIKYISGNYNQNLAYAVIFSIDSLEKDLMLLNRIFDQLLKPKLGEIDKDNIESLNYVLADEQKQTDGECHLTNREIEILKLIVQGHINKEIADKLNISLNTVLSHRKNIISKTGIRTVSGLTFYAISNGFVSSGTFRV